MKYQHNYYYLILFFIFYHSTIAQTSWYYTEDFESLETITTIDDKSITSISPGIKIWYDGGSDAYQNSTEYNSGGSSYAIVGPGDHTDIDVDGNVEEKPYYGSIYTNRLDLSNVSELSINIAHLLTNKSADKFSICQTKSSGYDSLFQDCYISCNNPGGYIAIEYSNDDGITFNEVDRINASDLNAIYSTSQQFKNSKIECKAIACEGLSILDDIFGIGTPKTICETACGETWSNKDPGGYYWDSSEINLNSVITGTDKDKNVILKIKSYLPEFDNGFDSFGFIVDGSYARFFMDDVTIKTTGFPEFSEDTILPNSDNITNGRTLYNTETFDDESNDWGIWEDGGRSAYSTDFLAVSGRGICLRDFYSGKSNGVDAITGEDLGFQKPTYSSIVTKNLDFTEVKDLEMSFSFVPYQMSTYDPTSIELKAAGNDNLVNDDGESILGYVPGSDRVVISISTNSGIDYTVLKTLTYAEDFINKVRYDINVNIPGDLTSSGALTTTTKIKIQCFADTEEQQFYIDDVSLYTIGTSNSLEGTPRQLDWASYNQTTLNANASVDTYDQINSTFIIPEYFDDASFEGNNPSTDSEDVLGKPGIYGAVEHSDCESSEFGQSITQIYDSELNKMVFSFNLDEEEDTDRCRTDGLYDDRQRIEIKTYSQSYDYQKALEGETHYFAWKMKLPSGFDASDKFTHLHQIKPKGGENAGMPTITLTANGPKIDLDTGETTAPAQLNLRYSPSTVSQVTVTSAPISDLEGTWIQFLEKVTYGTENEGRYELLLYKDGDVGGTPILDFKSYSFETWKGGDFVRPKWGIYRSIIQPDKIKDETILFSDFLILEVTNKDDGKYGDLEDFGNYIESIVIEEETTNTACVASPPINLVVTNLDAIPLFTWDITTNNSVNHNFRYRAVGDTDWNKISLKDIQNQIEVSDLLTDTTYEWQVRALCEDGTGSNYLEAIGANFTLSNACVATPPINLTVTNLDTTPLFTWDITTNNSVNHNFRYRAVGNTYWNKISLQDVQNQIEATDLVANTTYEWQVRAVCEDGTGSNYLSAIGANFTTSSSSVASKQISTKESSSYSITQTILSYPNPTYGNVNFKLRLIDDNSVIIKLYSINGNEIFTNQTFSSNVSYQEIGTYDASKLASGVYFMKVFYNDRTDTLTFIKK